MANLAAFLSGLRPQSGQLVYTSQVLDPHVSQALCRQFNDQLAAMKQLRHEGIETMPEQSIRYIIRDYKSKNWQKRFIIPELADENTQYDRLKYYEHLLRGAESLLLPFGYTEERLDEIMEKKDAKKPVHLSDIKYSFCSSFKIDRFPVRE